MTLKENTAKQMTSFLNINNIQMKTKKRANMTDLTQREEKRIDNRNEPNTRVAAYSRY